MTRFTRGAMTARILFATLCVTAIVVLIAVPSVYGAGEDTKTSVEPAAPADPIKRGSEIGDSPIVTLADVLEAPEKYKDKQVIIEGSVGEVCQKKGCWMQLSATGADSPIRVTFVDYSFFVPKDSQGMLVRAEGRFSTKTLSKEDADHLEAEGAKLVRNADGTATELAFVATGVELRKAPPKKAKEEKSSKES